MKKTLFTLVALTLSSACSDGGTNGPGSSVAIKFGTAGSTASPSVPNLMASESTLTVGGVKRGSA